MLYGCSFPLPAGTGAVIPVGVGSDGGHCWCRGGCSAQKVRQVSPDYITAFILTNGISWWGILRVMGIKIPGIAPTCRLPSGAQQICYTCCCSKLYIYRKRAKQTRVWSPLTAGSPGVRPALSAAQVQHFCLPTPSPS